MPCPHTLYHTLLHPFREEVNAAMAAGGGGMPDVEDALAEMQEQLLIAAQERQLMERQTQERAGE